MDQLRITTGARPLPAVPVFLGDDGPYTFTPRKVVTVAYDVRAVAGQLLNGNTDIRADVVERQARWLRLCFGDAQWSRIAARRADPADPLTQAHIDQLYERMVQATTQLMKDNL